MTIRDYICARCKMPWAIQLSATLLMLTALFILVTVGTGQKAFVALGVIGAIAALVVVPANVALLVRATCPSCQNSLLKLLRFLPFASILPAKVKHCPFCGLELDQEHEAEIQKE